MPEAIDDTATDFSYVSPTDGVAKRTIIRSVELMTGQPRLRRMYLENQARPRANETFWDAAVRHLKLSVHYNTGGISQIPKDGPLVIVANHPFGVLDGIVISYIIAQVRSDFLVLTNSVLYQVPEIEAQLLPVDFSEDRGALMTNLQTRRSAREHLAKGGALVVFPGGAVSTVPRPHHKRAIDPRWKSFTAQLIVRSKAAVTPIFFDGQNSRLFQLASHLSQTLRLSLLFNEVSRRIGTRVQIVIGGTMAFDALPNFENGQELADKLRALTYALEDEVPQMNSMRSTSP